MNEKLMNESILADYAMTLRPYIVQTLLSCASEPSLVFQSRSGVDLPAIIRWSLYHCVLNTIIRNKLSGKIPEPEYFEQIREIIQVVFGPCYGKNNLKCHFIMENYNVESMELSTGVNSTIEIIKVCLKPNRFLRLKLENKEFHDVTLKFKTK